ncbi:tyrosine-protein kinase receptor isoform 1-T1 [Synchiropus picturatus]
MDVSKKQRTFFCHFILIVSCHALLDRFLEEEASPEFTQAEDSEGDDQILYCDFESPCLWTSSNHSDKNDWLVVSPAQPGDTPVGTIPLTDHSVGSSEGHFLLLSPSGSEVSGRCEHRLTSQVLLRSQRDCVLRLAVYESGPTLGNLTVLIKPVSLGSPTNSVPVNHQRQEDYRADWEVLEAVIGRVDEPFQVTLVYSSCVGKDSSTTVALDTIELTDCEADAEQQMTTPDLDCSESFHCDNSDYCIDQNQVCDFHTDCPFGEDEGFICGGLPFGSYCSFDEDECGWSASKENFGWRRVAGDELLMNRNMQGNALQRTQGHFLFLQIQKSHSLREASIQSHYFPPTVSTSACQIRFSLYLHGSFNGSLLVAIEENGTTAAPMAWERNSQSGDDWEGVALQLTGLTQGFHLRVTATWSHGSSADIALDDIAVVAACFATDLNSLMPLIDFEDFLSPLPEPSASDVSLVTWWFNSCGASGPYGPTQAQCDSTYRNKNVSVTVGKEGPLKGVQMWRVPATDRYMISAYGAAGGKGAKNHNKRNHGVFISAIFPLEKGETLYILVGHQGEDACPGRNPQTQRICLGESSVIEDGLRGEAGAEWAGGGGGGGGATYIFKMEGDELVPLLIAAGGGGNAYMEDSESSLDSLPMEQYENSTAAASSNGQTGAAGGGGGWRDGASPYLRAGKSLVEGAEGGSACQLAVSKLSWSTFGGYGGGGGACTAGGGGGGYRGGDAALTDDITADGQDGISFINPIGEIFLHPLAAMESHGECEIKVQLNCSHCQSQSCKREDETHLVLCLCHDDEILASDNVTCVSATGPQIPSLQDQMSTTLILAVVTSTVASVMALTCAGVILMWYRKKNDLHAVRGRLQSPEYKLSKIRSSTIMTDYNPNYCFAGKATSLSELKEVPRKNITLLRALGHGAFGEVYEGRVLGMAGDNCPMQVAIKTLPEICSEQDEMDFLMEALIMSKFSHENIVRCIGVSLNILPRFILLELMTGGDMKSFLRQNRPQAAQMSSLTMRELLRMARDIACGCRYLEENHFIHRDIAARNCLLTCAGADRVAKIGDFGMARDIYRASYYRKGGRAMLPVKWMPPEAFMEGIFTCKTDTWSFGVLLWEIFSLGYMPYPCKTNQEVLEFVTSGGRMDPPKGCPGPVYRIMTQCWQHCPEHRPNFSTILERINYCTQDPDVINTPLPVEYRPSTDDSSAIIRPADRNPSSLAPVPHTCTSQLSPLGLGSVAFLPQPTKPCLRTPPIHRDVEALEPSWAEPVPACKGSHSLHPEQEPHKPCSRTSSSSGSQRLKNKTKNLWNPTYGSWVFRGKKSVAQTQSMPLSSAASFSAAASEADAAKCSHLAPSSHASFSYPPPPCQNPASASYSEGGNGSKSGVDLAKLQSFPCGNVNYAYDEPSYEAESLPLVTPRAAEAPAGAHLGLTLGLQASACVPKLLLKRHASYGHEDVRRHAKAEKPTRDRDSGFSLSEDLSVTPI